ncbi:MAG TPA: peptidoglycan DD-metalloendopeptidase family protein [Candidatus Faecimonas gallistercoris]|nr:peptidoglycan DD-metalloendopeptidase family protein [Candidatus Faecimonas gallistercoris]
MKKNNMRSKVTRIVLILILGFTIPFLTAFTTPTPKTLYRVYLKGKSIGLIKSKTSLEKYIDQQQNQIKKEFGVDKVYLPEDLDIVKEVTFDNDISTTKEIYKKIENISPFTIKGYKISIEGIDSQSADNKKIKGKDQTIYVLDKKIFEDAIDNVVHSFISDSDYKNYANDTQKEIEDVGKIIEKIYLENTITITKTNVPVDETIYQDTNTLSSYLMFGTTEPQKKYTVNEGDTIEQIAFNNKISTEEFLIANPEFSSENSLLYAGQTVTLGILKPQVRVVEEDHVVFDEETNYQTKTEYDNTKEVGYSQVKQKGVKGVTRITQKVQKINGETVSVAKVGSGEVLKEPIDEIVVKGGKKSSYSGYGEAIATSGEWGWPATCSSISSPFGYRWGVLHDGTDIAGCGYGSNIFAAQSGTVVQSSYKFDNGEYITIDHHNGYYSMYAHMISGSRRVHVGDYVVKGQVIGSMGRTGAATGVHLHFSIWSGFPYRGGRALNAMSFY